MKMKEYRQRKTGSTVTNVEPCVRFLEKYRDRQFAQNLEQFLSEHPHLRAHCALVGGIGKDMPRIEVEFQTKRSHPDIPVEIERQDVNDIIGLQYRLVSPGMWGNLSSTASNIMFRCTISIRIRNYAPYMQKQEELPVYAPEPFGGGALPLPDPLHYLMRRHLPFEVPFFPPKGNQRLLDLGAFTKCGSSTHRLSDIHVPKVIFSDLNPGEADDIPFEWPSAHEKIWRQLELPQTATILVQSKVRLVRPSFLDGVWAFLWRVLRRLVFWR